MSKVDRKESRLSRRDFVRGAVLASATAASLPGDLLSASLPPQAAPAAPPQQTTLPPNIQAEVDAKIQTIFREHGDHLSDAQKADIRRLVAEAQKPLEAMRAFPIENSDQPGNVLKLYPDAGATVSAPGKRRG